MTKLVSVERNNNESNELGADCWDVTLERKGETRTITVQDWSAEDEDLDALWDMKEDMQA